MKKNILLATFLFAATLSGAAQESALTVTAYKNRVLEYSQQIKQSAAQRVAVLEAMRVAKTAFLPKIDFSGNMQYRINDLGMAFGETSIPMRNESYELQAGIVQPLYAGGNIHNSYKAAQVKTAIAEQAETLTVDNIIYTADVSYWSTAASKEMYEVMCQYVDIIESLAGVLTDRFEDGLISRTDLLQVQARLKEAEIQKTNAYKGYQLALQSLNVLMGQAPLDPVMIADSITMYQSLPLKVGNDVAFQNRPEFKIADLNIQYQERQVKLAKGKYNPSVSIGFKETWGTQMLNIDGSTRFNSVAFASVSIPLLRWGARFKESNAQKAVLLSQKYERQITEDAISKELANAWTNLTENTKLIEMANASVSISEDNLDINTFSYNEGKLPILDVLTAQITWVQSYSNLVQTWLQQKLSLADYKKAMGTR